MTRTVLMENTLAPEQVANPAFGIIAPGIAYVELGAGDLPSILYLKQQLEEPAPKDRPEQVTCFDYELTVHPLRPAGWKPENGSSEQDRLIAMFTHMDQLPERRMAVKQLNEEKYPSQTVSDWTEAYHHRFFRNNPDMVKWESEPRISNSFTERFVAALADYRDESAAESRRAAPAGSAIRRMAQAALAVAAGPLNAGAAHAPRPELKQAAA